MVDLMNTAGYAPALLSLDGYFGRTQAATGTVDPEFASHSFHSFFLTNENSYEKALKHLEGRGGALVAVGQLMPFVYGSRGATHVYAVDSDAAIPYAFTPLFGMLMSLAPTRADFLSLILSKPIPKGDARFFDATKDGVSLIWLFREIPVNPFLAESLELLLSDEIGRRVNFLVRDKVKKSVVESLEKFRSLMTYGTPNAALTKLTYKDEGGRGGPLSSETEYQRQRALFNEGRITGVVADLGGKRWRRFIDRMQEGVGTVYISNVEDWILDAAIRSKDYSPVYPFYENLMALPGAENAVIVSALSLVQTHVSPLAEYVARAIPMELSPFEAGAVAAAFASARFFMSEKDPSKFSPTHPPYAFSGLESVFGSDGPAIIADVRKAIEGGQLTSREFDKRMKEESEKYAALQPAVRRIFIRNLEFMKLVKPSTLLDETVEEEFEPSSVSGDTPADEIGDAGNPHVAGSGRRSKSSPVVTGSAKLPVSSCLTSLPR